MKNPCKDCLDRTITCHGVCKKYEAWKQYDAEVKRWLKEKAPQVNEGAVRGGIKNIKDRSKGWGKRRVKNYD